MVHGLTPYVPGEQPRLPNLVKLNTNENPYGPGERVLAALRAEAADTLRLYPDPASTRLREAIARHHGVQPQQVFVGNGSDEVLAHAFLALLKHERDGVALPLLFPDISYSFYPVYCGLYGIPHVQVPLSESFAIRVDDYLAHGADATGGIIFPNPNAPTGMALPRAEIARLLMARPGVPVVIDEAYVDFGAESAVALVDRHPNLLVVHTLSKSRSLAGLRVGYAIGHVDLVEALTRVKDSFNSYPLDRFAQAGAVAAFEDLEHFEQTRAAVMATREALVARLQTLGFEVLPSAANFVFARHPSHGGADLASRLRERSIIVRHFRTPSRIAPYLRITVGTDHQCDALIDALTAMLA